MRRADMRAIPELHHQCNQVDHHGREEMLPIVHLDVIDIADEETEVQGTGKNDEKPEDDFFQIHETSLAFPGR